MNDELKQLIKGNQKILDKLVDNNLSLLALVEPNGPEDDCNIKQFRIELQMTVNEFAKYVGITPVTYYKWEQSPIRQHAAVTRLINVLQLVKLVSPVVHEQLIKEAREN